MDLVLFSKKEASIYFDTKDKSDKWCQAINKILDPEPILAQDIKPEDIKPE